MKLEKFKKLITPITTNCLIFAMLAGIFALTVTNSTRSVFVNQAENLYYQGDTSKPEVTLMINVYWGNKYIPSMLKALKDYDVKTTFFVGGSWVNKFPELLLEIYNAGHEIGNHGFLHKDHDKLDYNGNQQEIFNTHKIVKEYIGQDMRLFAPPSGAFNQTTITVANNLGYSTIMWSRDTIDWRDHDTNLIYSRATGKMSNGDLILMHPTLDTAQALPKILQYCKEKGFKVVPVSQNIGLKGI